MTANITQAILATSGREGWASLKTYLRENADELEIFDTPFHEKIRVDNEEYPALDPFQLKLHIDRLSGLLATLLELERNAFDLEIEAVRSEATYRMALEQSAVELDMERRRLQTTALEARSKGFAAASQLYTDDRARQAHERTLADAADASLTELNDVMRLLQQKHDIRLKYENLFHARHMAPGNGHNYRERYQAVLSLATQIFMEILTRASAIVTGMSLIYDRKFDLFDDRAACHAIVKWLEAIKFEAGRLAGMEAEETVVISLTQPLYGDPLVSARDFRDQIENKGPKRFEFDPSDAFGNHIGIRLISLCAALDMDPDKLELSLDKLAYIKAEGWMTLPRQPAAAKKFADRPSVYLGGIPIFARSLSVIAERNTLIENISPFGQWVFEMSDRIINTKGYGGDRISDFPRNTINDIKIFLRVVRSRHG